MKAAKVPYLKKAQSHFNKAMRLSGERDGIDHACAEIAGYIDAHQAAEVYMVDDANAIMYCAGIRSSSNASSTALASVSAASWITDAGRNCLCHVPVNKEYRPHGIDCERGCKNHLLALLMLREMCSVSRLSRQFQSLLLKKYDSGGKIT